MTPVAIWFKDGFKFVPVDCSRDCHLAARRELFAFLWGQPQNRPVFECEEGCVEMDGRDWLCHVFTITNNSSENRPLNPCWYGGDKSQRRVTLVQTLVDDRLFGRKVR